MGCWSGGVMGRAKIGRVNGWTIGDRVSLESRVSNLEFPLPLLLVILIVLVIVISPTTEARNLLRTSVSDHRSQITGHVHSGFK